MKPQPTYSAWKSDQLKVLAVATEHQRERYLRGIGIVWGDAVAADVEAAAGCAPGGAARTQGEDHGAEETAHEARQAWEAGQARLLKAKEERVATMRRAHPLNAGSRALARDPAALLEEAQSRGCKGCLYEYRVTITDDPIWACQLGHDHGGRCGDYWERGRYAG